MERHARDQQCSASFTDHENADELDAGIVLRGRDLLFLSIL